MAKPRLRLTPEAKQALEKHLAESGLSDPRATVLWASDVPPTLDPESLREAEAGGRWCVGFYEGKTLPWFQKCKIEGLPFCFVQANYPKRLDGAILDWADGAFKVAEAQYKRAMNQPKRTIARLIALLILGIAIYFGLSGSWATAVWFFLLYGGAEFLMYSFDGSGSPREDDRAS
jgi:hypothetical protein